MSVKFMATFWNIPKNMKLALFHGKTWSVLMTGLPYRLLPQ